MSATALILSACGAGGPPSAGRDLTDEKVVLAVLSDQSGINKDLSGPNSLKVAAMAVAGFKEKHGDDAVIDEIQVVSAEER